VHPRRRVLRDGPPPANASTAAPSSFPSSWSAELEAADLRRLLGHPRILVVKDGARSATAFGEEAACTVPALRTDVVEPVGAGDAFAAGFLAGLLNGGDLRRALRLGHLTASSALRTTADHGPLPDADTVERLLGLGDEDWAGLSPDAQP
jgi:2-dehydro-3-deoxygluconokinase